MWNLWFLLLRLVRVAFILGPSILHWIVHPVPWELWGCPACLMTWHSSRYCESSEFLPLILLGNPFCGLWQSPHSHLLFSTAEKKETLSCLWADCSSPLSASSSKLQSPQWGSLTGSISLQQTYQLPYCHKLQISPGRLCLVLSSQESLYFVGSYPKFRKSWFITIVQLLMGSSLVGKSDPCYYLLSTG